MDLVSLVNAGEALAHFAAADLPGGDDFVDRIRPDDVEPLRRAAVLLAGSLRRRQQEDAIRQREWL